MTRWTQAQYDAWHTEQLARVNLLRDRYRDDTDPGDAGPESALQSKIVAWAKEWGKPCLSFPRTPHVRRFLPPGWPDVVIILPKGRVLWMELKEGKEGRISEDQKRMKLMFLALGHEIHEVRSYRRFLELVNPPRS